MVHRCDAAPDLRLLTLSVGPLPAARTWHVPGDAETIQRAVDLANPGDTILVGPGIYAENVDFEGKAIAVRSIAGAAATVIDGGGGCRRAVPPQ